MLPAQHWSYKFNNDSYNKCNEYLLGEYLLGEYLLGEYLLGEYLFSCIEEKARPETTRYEGESSSSASIFVDYVSELKLTSFTEH